METKEGCESMWDKSEAVALGPCVWIVGGGGLNGAWLLGCWTVYVIQPAITPPRLLVLLASGLNPSSPSFSMRKNTEALY